MAGQAFVFAAANPVARRNRARTLDREVEVDEIRPLAARAADVLRRRGLRRVRCWGSVPSSGNLSSWTRMAEGDWGLLYAGGGRFPLLLRVAFKARYRGLARRLWDHDEEGETWELMYFFDRAHPVDLGIAAVRRSFGFSEAWWPQGLQFLGSDALDNLLQAFGSVEGFVAAATQEARGAPAQLEADPEALLFGGPFRGVPEKPPRAPRRRREVDPDIHGRGLLAHEETVARLERHVGRAAFHNGLRGINHDGSWKAGEDYCICEVKSVTADNETSQLQKGLGQVLHNRFKARWSGVRARIDAYLIAEREPSGSELWRQLAAEHDVVFTWPERFGEDVRAP